MSDTVPYKNGELLSFVQYGDQNGEPILVQHGMIASIRDPRLFQRLIDAGARLIVTARPGYGQSSAHVMQNIAEWGDITAVLVDELGLSQFDVLGISSGAPYSYAIGHRLPDRVRNLFILSGTPALYDERVLSYWPYPTNKNTSMTEMQALAYELFFSHLSEDDRHQADISDSMMNDCFGIAQDLMLRCMDWGFQLPDVKARVIMQHSRSDESVPFITAQITSALLPDCRFIVRENEPHFSPQVLDHFIHTVILASE
jgi:pimeloyl-ACP methyl ester carboxylesterase